MQHKKAVSMIIGAQWGDEGKGKWIDILAPKADIVCRFQGGNNAGHTLYINGKKSVLHQIPSGIFHDSQVAVIGAGVVLNPTQLVEEIENINNTVQLTPDRFWISEKAHIITPWHVFQDCKREEGAKNPIGTTKRGIGPTYGDKIQRVGLRCSEYIDPTKYKTWLEERLEDEEFKQHFEAESNKADWKQFESAREKIAAFVCDSEQKLRKSIKEGKEILCEGAQGTLLDINHGTFPCVTSSSTISGGALASLGLGAKTVKSIVGIGKAYTTRVGEGPFPTELTDEVGKTLGEKGQEFGATTARPRRCGWFDAVAMRYAVDVNGFDEIYLNKLDVLSGLDELKVATSYEHPQLGTLTDLPTNTQVLNECTPKYQTFKGWKEELDGFKTFDQLPQAAKDYVLAIEELCEVRVGAVGTGPGREDILMRAE